jgi:hypothetical protein
LYCTTTEVDPKRGETAEWGKPNEFAGATTWGSATEYLVIIWAPSFTRNGREINMAAVQEG